MENSTQKPRALLFWVQPRKTIRALIEEKPKAYILWFALLHGLLGGLYWMSTLALALPRLPAMAVLSLALVGGALLGVVQLYFMSWLYLHCGRWLGGTGFYTALKCAVGWSFYPFIFTGCLGILGALSFSHPLLQGTIGLFSLITFIWGIVLLCQVITEAHHFSSAWRGCATIIIALLLILGVFFILGLVEALLQ